MGLKIDYKYAGVIVGDSRLISTQSGSLGYQVMLSCDDGDTAFIIWLTPKNRARAIKTFEMLGITREHLAEKNYLEYQLALDIEGKEVSFGTREEEYNGKKSIKVSWLGKKSSGDLTQDAADFFGQAVANDSPASNDDSRPLVKDEDIPF